MTYINQFFGDQTVRDIIQELFPNPKYKLHVQQFEGHNRELFHHHVVVHKNNKKKEMIAFDSTDDVQDINKNHNDILCQSYSLFKYLEDKYDDSHYKRQLQLINMYRLLINNFFFTNKIRNEVGDTGWYDYTNKKPLKKFKNKKDWDTFFSEIIKVLNDWAEYGYHWFIGDNKKKSKINFTRHSL